MKSNFRFHLLSIPHLPQSEEYMSCAFTQKNRKLAKMLTDLGHEVIFYGSEGSDVVEYCDNDNIKFFQTHTLKDIRESYGEGDNRFEIGYNWREKDFKHDLNLPKKTKVTQIFVENTIKHIEKIKKSDDFLLLTQGEYQRVIAEAVQLRLTCEPGIGYRGSYAPYRAFESTYIQNFTYGSEHPRQSINGDYYHRVIPNYFDPDDFEFSDVKDEYYLYIGRMIARKGILTAYKACKEAGVKLIIAGQGGVVLPDGSLTATDSPDFRFPAGDWEYVGYVDVAKRKQLMAKAKAVLVPTEYLEPFAGVHVEAMLSGTPVITTDFGVFPDTVINGYNGYRCSTLNDFVEAIQDVRTLDYQEIRNYAERFLMGNVALQFDKWFRDLYQLYLSYNIEGTKGWHFIPGKEDDNS